LIPDPYAVADSKWPEGRKGCSGIVNAPFGINFLYNARFVILADDSEKWRPNAYRDELWGTRTVFEFATVKLLDFRSRWEELQRSRSPFALVVMSHLKAHATTRDRQGRLRWKLSLAKILLERGYKEKQADYLFRFMDYVLALPEDLEMEFDREVTKFVEEGKGMYISRFERRAMERGMQEGLEQGIKQGKTEGEIQGEIKAARAAVVDVLESRFDRVPRKLSSQLNKITDAGRLHALIRQAATAATMRDFERQLSS
jgi:hypothetical protein